MSELLKACFEPWWAHLIWPVVLAATIGLDKLRLFHRSRSLAAWIVTTPLAGEALVALVAIGVNLVPIFAGWTRPPSLHDEISYLFAAQTFAQGRLTNPPPPMAEHFQTFHQIVSPTWASKFPPGQGLALAAGMLFGSPRVGLIGTVALACAAVCWMCRGCAGVGARGAIAAGLLAAVHPLSIQWAQEYWGGGVAMLGGALFAGAMMRIARAPGAVRARDGLIAAIGLSLLANSRPLEGLLIAAIVGAWVVWRVVSRGATRQVLRRAMPAALAVLVPIGAWMCYYNYRVTGSAFTLPYSAHARQYMRAPLFRWQAINTPTATVPIPHIAWFHHNVEFAEYDFQRSFGGFLSAGAWHWYYITRDVLRPTLPAIALIVGAIALAFAPRRNRTASKGRQCVTARVLIATIVIAIMAHICLTPWMRATYLAAGIGLFFALLALGWRAIGATWSRPIATALLTATVATWAAAGFGHLSSQASDPNDMPSLRKRFARQITENTGRSIVFVAYSDGPQQLFEWVYNPPELSTEPVIWVHGTTPESNGRTLEAFPDRSVWTLIVTDRKVELRCVINRVESRR